MKRKKLVAIFAALMVALSTSIPVFAAESTKMESQMDQNIPSDSIASAIQCNAKIDPTCPWTEDTQVKETIPTYDLDNNVKGYILNLSTNGKDTGYMVYDISADEPVLIEFGYDDVYSIQGEDVTKKSELGQSKLIPVGMGEYVLQRGNDLYTIKTNTKITDQKDEIRKVVEKKEANIAECVQSGQIASTLSTRAQEIYSSVSVPNLWKTGYQPVRMSWYEGNNKFCTPVFGVNLLKYWTECRNISNLYTKSPGIELRTTFDKLCITMQTNPNTGGTTSKNAYNGIASYCSTYGYTTPKGSAFKDGFDWAWYKTQIINGNFMHVSALVENYENNGKKNIHHSFSGVGYQETSTGNYLRVGDQWDRSYSHFFNVSLYGNDIGNLFYYRW